MRTDGIQTKCAICGENDPRVLKEKHHTFGRANGNEILYLCANCHGKISRDQDSAGPKARNRNASDKDRLGFVLISVGSLLEVVGARLKLIGRDLHGNSR
jgi:hypothetical protein